MAAARVVILGGGLAGLAAAVRLREAGCSVTVLEKRHVLGGRASSFTPPGEAAPIDNCQHVLLGCCTNFIDFLERTDSLGQVRFYQRFDFLGDAGRATLASSLLPAPLHFLPSLLRFQHLSLADRHALVRAVLAILRTPRPYPDVPFMDWLRARRQSAAVIDRFWRVIMTSALNEDPERLSARPAFHVIVDSFARNSRGHRMGVPRVPLSEMYSPEKISRWAALRMGAIIAGVEMEQARVRAVLLQTGERIEADHFVSALPPDALANIFSAEQRAGWPPLEQWKRLEWSPITGIHLWYDREVMRLPHAVVVGKTIQWIFNKSATGAGGAGPGSAGEVQYLQVVISASRTLLIMKREEILELVQREIAEVLPEARAAKVERAVVVKETESTPCFPPGYEARRPGAETPFGNFFLAGDWTATGWPPTMESAVRSGYRAAECVAQAAGAPQDFLVPDLPTDPLARLFMA